MQCARGLLDVSFSSFLFSTLIINWTRKRINGKKETVRKTRKRKREEREDRTGLGWNLAVSFSGRSGLVDDVVSRGVFLQRPNRLAFHFHTHTYTYTHRPSSCPVLFPSRCRPGAFDSPSTPTTRSPCPRTETNARRNARGAPSQPAKFPLPPALFPPNPPMSPPSSLPAPLTSLVIPHTSHISFITYHLLSIIYHLLLPLC
jgi:hypothetical protein